MTFADLLAKLETGAALKANRVKDMKTSLRYLAAALGYPTLEACPLDAVCRDPQAWEQALEAHFSTLTAQGQPTSAATRRNTRNNCRVIFRLAETHGCLPVPLPPGLLAKPLRRNVRNGWRQTSLYPASYRPQSGPRHFGLRQAQWPPDIQAGWQEYRQRCGLRLRERTFKKYADELEIYLGYFANICGRQPTWEDVFAVAQLTEFIRWHAARLQRPISAQGWSIACFVAAMAKVLAHPHARALADLRNGLRQPEPVHNKRAHWVPLATLEQIGEACLAEGRRPFLTTDAMHPGARRATYFQRGLMLKLLVRVPLRQRNVREMRLGTNLYEDQAGHWQLYFSGSELKIGHRGSQVHVYAVDLTEYAPDILPGLHEFLQVHRPRLPNAAASPFVFLSSHGTPFPDAGLREEISYVVDLYTGKRFYPHLIRTIWATEYLEKTQNFTTAAVLLGDTVATVMKTYYSIIHKDHHANAKAFLATALRP